MKLNRINLLLITTVALLGFLPVCVNAKEGSVRKSVILDSEEAVQKPIIVSSTDEEAIAREPLHDIKEAEVDEHSAEKKPVKETRVDNDKVTNNEENTDEESKAKEEEAKETWKVEPGWTYEDQLPEEITPEHRKAVKSETYSFETEVSRLMNLIINSLYKEREIFLRELISNASDALDKIRFQSLTDPKALRKDPMMHVKIVADNLHKSIVITDTGIGMTPKQLKDNLGTIARSGTTDFLSNFKNDTSAVSQIGQFGVGFYSVFLVADRVTVASKHNDEEDQYIWESTAINDFTIMKDPRGNTLARGTQITVYLKDDALMFLDNKILANLVQKYSQFINFPIKMWMKDPFRSRERTMNEQIDDLYYEQNPDQKPERGTTDEEEGIVYGWGIINYDVPIWLRDPKEVTAENHTEFYQSLTNTPIPPLAWSHYRGEGEVQFHSMLYIPEAAENTFYENIQKGINNMPLRLFVKHVFITEDVELVPDWLSFVRGLVDADDLPLNVSRETLQYNHKLQIITRYLIKKTLDMLKGLSADKEKYQKFLSQFSVSLKLGALKDERNRRKLLKLLRFASSYDTEGFSSSLDDYIDRTKAGQESIFYLAGGSVEEIQQSPHVEGLLARGYEILYFMDPMDEIMVENIPGYNGRKFVNIAKEEDFPEDDVDKERDELLKNKFEPLAGWLTEILDEYVETVVVSHRLTSSPMAIVAQKEGMTSHAQRVFEAQGGDMKEPGMAEQMEYRVNLKKILEINPEHPFILTLLDQVHAKSVTEHTGSLVRLMYESTAIRSGYNIKDVISFTNRVEKLVRKSIGVPLGDHSRKPSFKLAEDKTEAERLKDDEMKNANLDDEEELDELDHDEL